MEMVLASASRSPVVIFSISSCCMCHAVKRLFIEIGVEPAVHELDQDPNGKEIEKVLMRLLGRKPPVPVVFIGGQLVGPIETVMSLHLSGSLIRLLREAGALQA